MFKQELKNVLHQKRMTAAELARRTGVPKQTISDWLSGTQPRNIELVRRVAEELDVAVTQLLFGNTAKSEARAELKEAKEELKRRELDLNFAQRYRNFFFENAYGMFRMIDLRTGRPVDLSRSWEAGLGWTNAELKTMNWLDLVHPEDRDRVAEVAQRNVTSDAPYSEVTHRVRRKDATYLRVQSRIKVDLASQLMMSITIPMSVVEVLRKSDKSDLVKTS